MEKKKKRKLAWITGFNIILVTVVVIAMLLMVLSELVLDKDVGIFGYTLCTGARDSVLLVKDSAQILEIPMLAMIAGYVNSVPGYVTVIFPPCVLLVILQIIASNIEKKNGGEEEEEKISAENTADQQKRSKKPAEETAHVYRPVNAQAAETVQEQASAPKPADDLMLENQQLKAALQQSQNQNEELRVRAVQAIRKAREQQVMYPYPPMQQMPPQMPYPPQYPVYPVYLQQPYGGMYYPPQQPPYYPPQGGYYNYPPQQGPMQ